jgi:hypothetical protein
VAQPVGVARDVDGDDAPGVHAEGEDGASARLPSVLVGEPPQVGPLRVEGRREVLGVVVPFIEVTGSDEGTTQGPIG